MRYLVAASFCLAVLAGCAGQDEFAVVGTLERDRIALTAELREPVVAIHVREGDRVAAGEVLLELDTGRAFAERERLAAQRDRLQRRLDELVRGPRREAIDEAQARLEAAQSTFSAARQQLERVQRLRAENVASARELDIARAEHDRAEGERDAAHSALEALLVGTTIEELDQARAAVAEAEAALALQVLTLERLVLRSPRAALVEALPLHLGETPQPGQALVVLRAVDLPPYARVYVPAAMRERLLPGTAVRLRIAGAEYEGTVRFLASEAAFTPFFALTEHDADRLSYLAEIDIARGEGLPTGVPVRTIALGEER